MTPVTGPAGADRLPWWIWVGVAALGAVNVAVVLAAFLR